MIFIGVLEIVNEKRAQHSVIRNGTMFKKVADPVHVNILTVLSEGQINKLPTPSALPMMYNSEPSNYSERWLRDTFVNAL